MIIGAIHGGYELNTATLVFKLRDDIQNGLITVPQDITLYLLPIFNPDGYYDYLNLPQGRSNARGADLTAIGMPYGRRIGIARAVSITPTSRQVRSLFLNRNNVRPAPSFLLEHHVEALISYHSKMSAIFAGGRPEPDPASDSLALCAVAGQFLFISTRERSGLSIYRSADRLGFPERHCRVDEVRSTEAVDCHAAGRQRGGRRRHPPHTRRRTRRTMLAPPNVHHRFVFSFLIHPGCLLQDDLCHRIRWI